MYLCESREAVKHFTRHYINTPNSIYLMHRERVQGRVTQVDVENLQLT